jgi:hypothetical protein
VAARYVLQMDADALDSTNVRRYWGNVDGEIVSGWELAVAWDVQGTPTQWRTLDQADAEDRRLLVELAARWHAPGRAA